MRFSAPVEKAETHFCTETSEHVAEFERGSRTVNVVEKETATEHREPVPVADKRGGPERDQDAKIDAEKILRIYRRLQLVGDVRLGC